MTSRSAVTTAGAAPGAEPSFPTAPYLHLDETIDRVVMTDFDVEAYTRKEYGRLPVDGQRLTADAALPAPLAGALAALQHLEATALAESRAMLATWTGNEARVTAFLATWLVDRHWISRALRDLDPGPACPGAEAVPAGGASPADGRSSSPTGENVSPPTGAPARLRVSARARLRRIQVDRIQPLLAPLWSAVAGESVTAAHMARMAIQEATLQAGLRALAPRLHGEARRVVEWAAQRHEDPARFFRAEAIARITRSRREANAARLVLSLTSPLDGGGVPDDALAAGLAVIGEDPRDRAALHRARFEITRLLPGPNLPDPYLAGLSRTEATWLST